jgi:EAL domain-containing protein (putative c-di-GMP-specific phosphodiesterase class I)
LLGVKGEIILPGAFIPSAERYGLIGVIDRWVIQTAFRRYAALFDRSSAGPMIAINLSGNSLNDDRLLDFVHQQFAESGIMPGRICFEITETAAIYDLSRTTRFITALKDQGCSFALDDFGSSLSSFTYLKKLPIDFLKIAGSFVQNMVDDPIDHAVVAAINQVGHIMGIHTIAEYVESQTVLEQLRELGVDSAQGYALGYPRPLQECPVRRPALR